MDDDECVGAIVCKLDRYKEANRGYIAMLDVDEKYRRKKIGNEKIHFKFDFNFIKITKNKLFGFCQLSKGSNLVTSAIKRMIQHNADEV